MVQGTSRFLNGGMPASKGIYDIGIYVYINPVKSLIATLISRKTFWHHFRKDPRNTKLIKMLVLTSKGISRLQICPLFIFGNNPPQMVARDLNIGVFQGLAAFIEGQI